MVVLTQVFQSTSLQQFSRSQTQPEKPMNEPFTNKIQKNHSCPQKRSKPIYQSEIQKPAKRLETISQEMDLEVKDCIERILLKMSNAKIPTLHPPFFQKSLTRFRQQAYSFKLKATVDETLVDQKKYSEGLKILSDFILGFDEEYIDTYVQQIRQPYIRKIFNEGYEIDKVNFKKLNSEFQLRKEIEDVLVQTSEWLIQLELLEDILSRVELYFGIDFPPITERLKHQGASNRKGTWLDYFSSLIRKSTSFMLRKSSSVVRNTTYASFISPAFAMLTWAVIGGNSSLPWSGGLDPKMFIAPIIAFSVPYILDNLAQNIDRRDFQSMLISWAVEFEKVNKGIHRFNDMLVNEINQCCNASNYDYFLIHRTNLEKYIESLRKSVKNVSDFSPQIFEEMKERTKAYFSQYTEVREGEWLLVMTPQQAQRSVNFQKNLSKPNENTPQKVQTNSKVQNQQNQTDKKVEESTNKKKEEYYRSTKVSSEESGQQFTKLASQQVHQALNKM